MDKLLRWRNFAQQFHGKDFWSGIFDNPETNKILSGFNDMFDGTPNFPRSDIFKNEREIIILIELPGINKQNIELSIADDRLEIKGDIPFPYPSHSKVAVERHYGPFARTIQLPEIVNKDRVKAKFTNGLLEIYISRTQQARAETVKIE